MLRNRVARYGAYRHVALTAILLIASDAQGQRTRSTVCELVPTARAASVVTQDLTFVHHLVVLRDGTMFLSDAASRSIFRLDATLQSSRRVAGRGDGPGELRGPARLSVTPTGILATDVQASRVSEFDRDGRLMTSVVPNVIDVLRARAAPAHLERAFPGRLVLQRPSIARSSRDVRPDPQGGYLTLETDFSGSRIDTVARHSPLVMEMVQSQEAQPKPLFSPVQAPTIVAYSATGDASALLRQPRMSDGTTSLLVRFRTAESSAIERKLAYPIIRLTRRDREALMERAGASIEPAARAAIARMLNSFPSMPGAIFAFVARDRMLWISRQAVNDSTAFEIYSFDGAQRMSCPVSVRTRVFEAAGDTAWGVVYDEDQVPWPTRFLIRQRLTP